VSVDGTVIEGRSQIDQGLVTGETLPVAAGKGSQVYAGTLNLSGTLQIRVSAAERGTLLADITRMLDRALEARSHYVRLADRAATPGLPASPPPASLPASSPPRHSPLCWAGSRSGRVGTTPSSRQSRC